MWVNLTRRSPGWLLAVDIDSGVVSKVGGKPFYPNDQADFKYREIRGVVPELGLVIIHAITVDQEDKVWAVSLKDGSLVRELFSGRLGPQATSYFDSVVL